MRRALLASVCLVACAATAAGAQCPDGTPPPCAAPRRAATVRTPPPEARARRFLLLPFRNVTRAPAQDWLVTGAPLMLADALGHFRDLVVVPDEVLTAARRRLALPPDAAPDATQLKRLAEETDGWTAVTGTVLATGGRVRLSVQALDIPTSRVLVRADTSIGADEEIRDALNSLGARLLEPTGVSATGADLGAPPTTSVDAYRAYVRGIDLLHRSAYRRATEAFAEAVRLDSTFALAWARLAMAAGGANPAMMADPASPMFRAVEQAARYAGRLLPRQAQLVRSVQAFTRGQPSRARWIADSLVRTDRDDLDAREWLASVEWLNPVLDTTVTPPRHESSHNRVVLLAREVLERDPGRRNLYGILTLAYATGAGMVGCLNGLRREPGSLMAMIFSQPDVCVVSVLRDSIEFVPREDWNRLPEAERVRLRRRSADAAMEWIERWLAAGPEEGEAHWWASRVAEMRDDLPRALREAVAAESLGVERASMLELGPGRRLILSVSMGRYAAAGALADSLLANGSLAKAPLIPVFDRTRRFGTAALLLSGRWVSAATLAAAIGTPSGGQPPCSNLAGELGPGTVVSVPNDALRALMDTVALHFGEASAVSALARCVENLATTLLVDSTSGRRSTAGAALLTAADSLHRAGNAPVAYRAARAAWNADSARRSALAGRDWFVQRARSLAVGRGFVPGGAIVDADSAVFTFRRVEQGPLELDAPGLATNWSFAVVLGPTASHPVLFGVRLAHGLAPTERGASGGLSELVAAMQTRNAFVNIDGPAVPGSTPLVTATADGFRVVVRGPFVDEMRRVRPASALFQSSPCIAVTDGLCARPSIAIDYR